MRRIGYRWALWALLAAPGVYWLQDYWRDPLAYGEIVHATGILAARLLIVALAITPLMRVWPRARWLLWLRRQRRYLGVAVFAYALLHAVIYLQRQADLAAIVEDATMAAIWTGWVALAIMLALAATSNDASVRRLGRRWALLHRAVYVAAVLACAHWVLSAFDPVPGYWQFGVLGALEILRLARRRAG